ncbi:periplasmic murein peptide-binding protein [Treponema primitia ZAS-2]|uniref:Periplasmic murein peptide-binding protein n=1 Tax=Treponema primitia (strain ATCC BAA-887 / DSM 12427 / ZAS-2) TaxID=545694 RepID=F5YQF7_TREPZ|nr:peptide ABC transporter substrate-binding protein [Treponema primitia]AEF86446.1 periplasmic murein peptide-binding protein [Treponema primitia ZAS-2]
MKKNFVLSVLLVLAAALALTGCGGKKATAASGTQMTIVVGSEPNSIDPALNTAVDGAVYLVQSFEGLYKYEDNGKGNAVLVPGQAESAPQKTVNPDGSVTYLFKLRNNLKWSDGQAFTAKDFVYGWQRLVDPETAADYNYMIDMVKNANEIMDGALDKSQLGIRAIDDRTLEIILTYDCPYFFEIAAFPAAFPVRADVIAKAADQWTFSPSTYISNGPYRLKEWVHNSYLLYEKNPNYYEPVTGPDTLRFSLMDDDNAILAGFRSGDIDFAENPPVDEIPTLLSSGTLTIADYLGTYFVTFNNQKAPFNDARVRRAFSLAIDRNYLIDQITRTGEKPATAYVPSGISDAAGAGSDFRDIGKGYYSVAPTDYNSNVAEAKRLLAEAGYPEGRGFPVVEYLFNTNDRHRAIGEALQNMWRTVLGVNVTLGNQDWAVFIDNRKTGNYLIARHGWIADYNDPISFLDMFVTGGGNNDPQYSSPRYDALLAAAKATSVPEERFRYMHQAEDIFMGEDAAVAPIYFYTQPYMLKPSIKGLYYTPLGFFFYKNVTGL